MANGLREKIGPTKEELLLIQKVWNPPRSRNPPLEKECKLAKRDRRAMVHVRWSRIDQESIIYQKMVSYL